MITKAEKTGFIVIGLVAILAFNFWKDVMAPYGVTEVAKVKSDNGKKNKNPSKQDKADNTISEVTILQKWDLPSDLKEVSGIAYIDEQRFACIQDEEGKIFIYNTTSGKIEKQIPFSTAGDYEDITLKGNTAYIVRADGTLYEVDINSTKNSAKSTRRL
jgi:uncharacterized protein YjiK